ncbi:MAG: GAF domain-containing protein, partial [Armatimonadetes bacterium]|nr:GAF domain-containing protein [Armatimonadota bacterium]
MPNRTGVGALLDRFRRDLRPLVAITACFGDHKQGTLEGALEVRRRLWFSEPEEAVFNRFAKAVGAALHRAEERRRHLAAATASFGEDLVEALRFLTAHGAEKLGAEVWTVYLYAQDEDKLVLRYAVGIPWQVVGRVKYGPGEGLTGKAFQDRTAHRYDNPRGTKGWKGIQFREVLAVDPTFQAGPLLIAPISEPTGDVAGVLKVEKPLSADGDQFTATDEEVAVRIGQLIGGVVALHRDRERLRQRARNLEAVVTQQQEIAEAGGQLQALELVHRLVAERAGASVDVLLFWHYQQAASADGSYAFCAGAGCRFTTEMGENENEWRKWSLARGSGLMVHAAESGEPCTYLTHLADSDMPQYLPLRDTKSICIVPIGTGHTVFACLVAESSEPDGVPPDLRAFMQSQAGATGAVIHRFAIFAELLGGHVNHCVSHLSGRLAQMLQRCADHEQGWSLGEASQKDVSGVIAGLLDLVERSRWLVALTAGGLTEVMMPRVVNLADAVGDRVASWRNVRGSPCIEFQADPSGALAASDPDYVAEALDRLLGNAVRL